MVKEHRIYTTDFEAHISVGIVSRQLLFLNEISIEIQPSEWRHDLWSPIIVLYGMSLIFMT